MSENTITSFSRLYPQIKNFVFIGESGGGKSEIAMNLALELAGLNEKPVHFFDLDMTKPLFRSRDASGFLESAGVSVHFEEQFMDAPTAAGGVAELMRDGECRVVLDVGGDYIGARSIGGYSMYLNRPNCAVFYVINPYRPWSMDIEHIDAVLGQTLGVSHVQLSGLHLLGNPNLGTDSTPEEIIKGAAKLYDTVSEYKSIELFTVEESMLPRLTEALPSPIVPIRLMMSCDWAQ